jgi:UDP-glucose:glycoprotein glucosyltransferase
MLRFSKLPWGLAVFLSAAYNVSAGPSVNVALNAAFASGPYLLELL